jgi:hypothetical protein
MVVLRRTPKDLLFLPPEFPMNTRIARRAAVISGAVAMLAITVSAVRPPVKGVTYRLRMTTRLPAMMAQLRNGDATGPEFVARVKAVGKNARFEMQSVPQGAPIGPEDYLLFLESGRAIMVNTAEKTFSEAPAGLGGSGGSLGMLGSIAGRSRAQADGRGGAPQMEITGIDMDLQQLDGDTLQGRQVRHYQLVAEMNIQVMNTMAPLRVEMEMWTADLPYQIVNPFDISGTVSPDDPASKLTSRLLAERRKIQGTPIKTIMNMTISGLGNGAVPPLEFGQTTEIMDIKEMDIDPKQLDVPVGYTRKEPGSGRGGGVVEKKPFALR